MAVDWSSLPPDLLRRIGDHHLAANDIDYYMDMRSVCHSWRSAIPKPRPLGVGADHRFRPRQWVMVDESESKVDADDRRLFVNVSTGRFLYRRVPMLRDHDLLAASAGLLVLREKISPHATCVLELFTGTVLPTPDNYEDEDMITVYSVADPASELRVVQFPLKSDDCPWFDVRSTVAHAGHVYVLDSVGLCVFRIIDAEERLSYGYGELITRVDFGLDGSMLYLVECAGELLVVRLQQICIAAEVYRVDVERKVLERLHSIGRRALFLGLTRCLWVDADKFPSIDPNCIYHEQTHYSEEEMRGWRETYRYDLSNGGRRDDVIDDLNMNTDGPIGPISSAKVLHNYCISDLPPFLHFSSP